jgi:hypothetical protein
MTNAQDVTDFLSAAFFVTPVFVFLWMGWLYWMRGREPARGAVSVQYEPPDNLTPGECGALLEGAVPVRTITATIVDLSVREFLAIEQEDDSSSPAPKGYTNYIFHLLKPQDDWSSLKPHEQAILRGLFIPTNYLRLLSDAMSHLQQASGNPALAAAFSRVQTMTAENPLTRAAMDAPQTTRSTVALAELQDHFYPYLAAIRASVFDTLVAGGFYDGRPDKIWRLYAAKGFALGFAMVVVGVLLATRTHTALLPRILTAVLTGVMVVAFGKLLSPRTTAGTQAVTRILGFKDFLEHVEKDQIERVERSPELFEKYLPYAMALVVENQWTRALGDAKVPPPKWYRRKYGDDFLPVHLVADLNGLSSQAGSVMTSKPASAA